MVASVLVDQLHQWWVPFLWLSRYLIGYLVESVKELKEEIEVLRAEKAEKE